MPARAANGVTGLLVGRLGVPVPGIWMLGVRGRRTGAVRETPVCLLGLPDGRAYLVAPRGVTGWVRNLRAAGGGGLRRGRRVVRFGAREVTGEERVEALAAYLDRFGRLTGRFFAVPPGAGAAELAEVAHRHPVFRLGAPP